MDETTKQQDMASTASNLIRKVQIKKEYRLPMGWKQSLT